MITQPACKFACELDGENQVMVISLTGKLDPIATEQLTPHIEEAYRAGVRRFVFDLSELVYVGSLGLRLFVALHNQVKATGGAVVLCAPTVPVRTILEMTKLNRLLRSYTNRHEAVDATLV
jgi:anti-sigma B factor antagonist